MVEKDYYSILNVRRNAPVDEIKASYRLLSTHLHPDKIRRKTANKSNSNNNNQQQQQQGAEKESKEEKGEEQEDAKEDNASFLTIQRAYEVLSDDTKRWVYDRHGEPGVKFLEARMANAGARASSASSAGGGSGAGGAGGGGGGASFPSAMFLQRQAFRSQYFLQQQLDKQISRALEKRRQDDEERQLMLQEKEWIASEEDEITILVQNNPVLTFANTTSLEIDKKNTVSFEPRLQFAQMTATAGFSTSWTHLFSKNTKATLTTSFGTDEDTESTLSVKRKLSKNMSGTISVSANGRQLDSMTARLDRKLSSNIVGSMSLTLREKGAASLSTSIQFKKQPNVFNCGIDLDASPALSLSSPSSSSSSSSSGNGSDFYEMDSSSSSSSRSLLAIRPNFSIFRTISRKSVVFVNASTSRIMFGTQTYVSPRARLGFGFGKQDNVYFLFLSFERGSITFKFPIRLPIHSFFSLVVTSVISFSLFSGAKYFWRMSKRKQKQRLLEEQVSEYGHLLLSQYRMTLRQQDLMRSRANQIQQDEAMLGGLWINVAYYEPVDLSVDTRKKGVEEDDDDDDDEGYDDDDDDDNGEGGAGGGKGGGGAAGRLGDVGSLPLYIDARIPLQYYVRHSRLYLPGQESKSTVLGLCNPTTIGDKNTHSSLSAAEMKLFVRYMWRNVEYVVTVGDTEPLSLPDPSHARYADY